MAILWFIAAALALAAFLLNYVNEGRIQWPMLGATLFTVFMGFNSLQRSKSHGS